MTDNHKRRFLTCVEGDRISNLPEHLIGSILERLAVQDAVRTSVLSKRWRYKWTTMTSLVLDEEFAKKIVKYGAFGLNGFIRIVNQVLILHPRPISKLTLYIPNMFLDSFQEVDQWMLFLSRNGVRELVLINANWLYLLPSHVFSCSELRNLKLANCIFKSPLGFVGFPYLEDVFLRNVVFGTNFSGAMVNLPRLRKLTLHSCTHVYNLDINAPNLQCLSLVTCPDAMLCRLANNPSLTVVGITLRRPLENFLRVEYMNLARLLSILRNVQQFFIDGHFIKDRNLSCVEEDRISNLPEHLIGSILERLTVQDAVRTSVLSKRWRYRWTTMTSLVLDEQFAKKIVKYVAFGLNGFIRIVNQILILHPRAISKLSLYIPNISLDSFQEVHQWMLFLSRSSVRELVLFNANSFYPLPSHVFSCSELKKLKLENCIFNTPLEFEGFPNLKDLFLKNIVFGPNCCVTKFLSADKMSNWLLHADNSIEFLWFKDIQLSDMDQVQSVLSLLQTSPNLVRLDIIYSPMPQGMHYNVEPALNHLESPNCLGRTLKQLETMSIKSLTGSRTQMLFRKLLLAHSPSHDKLTIIVSKTSDALQRLNIAKEIMQFPRASRQAEIIYLDPRS
ncbi:F-box domain, cyclin-like protein [Cynara cardunculus var. scolymus]|uniref:F-box domain, cyclin-like protein n=1 Tax=Cynara cardunculus var. scolymus TaxID=59895 RepID=A0A103Y0W6_CYNCS|nr:F-box domain, cyclin-like protein [Cynara cardunculus var. scolymus]